MLRQFIHTGIALLVAGSSLAAAQEVKVSWDQLECGAFGECFG